MEKWKNRGKISWLRQQAATARQSRPDKREARLRSPHLTACGFVSAATCLVDDGPSIRHRPWPDRVLPTAAAAMRGGGPPGLSPALVPSLLHEAPSRLRLLPASHAACGETDWLAAICTETQRAAAAVADSAHDTASASAACSFLPFTSTFSAPFSTCIPTIGFVSLSSSVPHPPLVTGGVRKVPQGLHPDLHARAGSLSGLGPSPSCCQGTATDPVAS